MALDFFCRCLNVRIHVDKGSVSESLENCIDNVAISDAFFANVFLVLAPNGAEILKKLQCLSHERENEHWRVNVCLNCGMETHAISKKDEFPLRKIFISTTMQQNMSTANLISNSKNFSPIYDVLISQPPDENHSTCLPLLPRNQLHSQLEELKAYTVHRLNAENEFLLERIRKFENEQMSIFSELQVQTRRDQNVLIQKLNNHYTEKENVISDDKPSDDHQDAGIPTIQLAAFSTIKPETVKKPHLSPVKSSPAPKSSALTIDDTIFVMDDVEIGRIEQDDSVHDESEPEVSDDDEAFAAQTADSFKLFATSLPIAMPGVWQSSAQAQEQDIVPGRKMEDPTSIAASIQALAMSVCGNDGTEMFGARPRPRLNTLD